MKKFVSFLLGLCLLGTSYGCVTYWGHDRHGREREEQRYRDEHHDRDRSGDHDRDSDRRDDRNDRGDHDRDRDRDHGNN